MVEIRRANESDIQGIRQVLDELGCPHPCEAVKGFWVAERDGQIVGVAKLGNLGPALFLSYVGVVEKYRGEGIAKQLLDTMLSGASKDVYLYTIDPDFFSRFQFVVTKSPDTIPSRETMDCEGCNPDKCVCMVRTSHDS